MSLLRVYKRVVVSVGSVFYMGDSISYPTSISRARSFGHTSIPSPLTATIAFNGKAIEEAERF